MCTFLIDEKKIQNYNVRYLTVRNITIRNLTVAKRLFQERTKYGGDTMEERKAIGHEIKVISNLIKRNLCQTPAFHNMEHMTGTHGWVIKYLYENRDRDIYQRDLENEFSVRRSTITGMIQIMEKNGLIVRESVENDARLKKLVLTERAIKLHCMVECTIAEFEKSICEGITEEEREVFFRVTEKLRNNLEN